MIVKLDFEKLKELTNTEKKVINFINANENKLSYMSIVDIAEETFTSPATVSRAIKKCGLNGFTELRYLVSKRENYNSDIGQINEILKKSLIEATNTIEQISINNILKSVDLIKNSTKIYVLARGLTELVAEEFSLKLQLLGYNVFEISDPNIMRKITMEIKPQELLFVFSLNGKTPELIESVENAVSIGANIISCCCSENSKLKELSTIYLKGFKYEHSSISKFEVTSRLPLNIISRIIIDYLAM
ncbi:MurR/RpiR family transcriptional regulator [Thermoanaerobacterium thermosaccharolyticum]|uniref:MurR/RpiR family transcriptional regulator n=1 Tax=Thermoanaerobacterium thermosaccharolyticum TaxID=1517 RepID=UPI0017804009|nr:MurR/RpiR family transcriptional regulator [Thermoanaerobacterium thermosaccharolyticum]MBE0069780.1 MurR/RpiR family transcriptional regulator [Thermoanaerobacterium thermosaccharolyticum]MBE0229507.1 MurR/RpiR family transcriptional regulator [Thermoanaerobacterium thermosaccharolyticum]